MKIKNNVTKYKKILNAVVIHGFFADIIYIILGIFSLSFVKIAIKGPKAGSKQV